MDILWYLLIALVVILLGMGYYFARVIIYPRTRTYEHVANVNVELGLLNLADWESWAKEEVHIASPYGYQLFSYWLPLENARGTVILVHGITVNVMASANYIPLFRELGFNVLAYDHRNHGKSGGKSTSFGYYERTDLKAVVDWVEARIGKDGLIGTHGESMGAGTVMMHGAIDPRVQFVIEDCGYADLVELFHYRVKQQYKLPGIVLLPLASLFSKLLIGFSFHQVKPYLCAREMEQPLLVIHGEKDDYIPPSHAQKIFDNKLHGVKEIWIAPNAAHAEALLKNPIEYRVKISSFLERVAAAQGDKPA